MFIGVSSVSVANPFRSNGSAFTPASIANLTFWIDASDAASITVDGSNNVSQWNDKSGNGFHAGQSNSAKRPSYTGSNQIKGRNVPNFDGSNDNLITTGTMSVSQPNTTFVVFKYPSGLSTTTRYLFDGSVNRQFIIVATPTTPSQINFGAGTTVGITSLTGIENATSYVTSVFNGASSQVRVNGVQRSTGNPGTNGVGTALVIGAFQSQAGSFWQGMIAEILIYSRALSGSEITTLESYLSSKWV